MKILKIFLITFSVIILLAGIGFFIFIQTFDLNRYKPQITAQLSKVLNRDVTIEKLSYQFSLKQGLLLSIDGMTIADDANFSTQPFCQIKSILFDVDVMTYLREKKIFVSRIEIDSAQVQMIRNKEGALNVQSMAYVNKASQSAEPASQQSTATASPNTQPQEAVSPSTNVKTAPMVLPELTIKSITIAQAAIRFVDETLTPPLTIPINAVDMELANFSLNQASPFKLACALWSDTQNVELAGVIQYFMDQSQVKISDVNWKTNLAQWPLAQMKKDIAPLAALPMDDRWEGQIDVLVKNMVVGPTGMSQLSAEGKIDDGKIHLKQLKYPFENIDVRFDANDTTLNFSEVFVRYASGKVIVKGVVNDYLKTRAMQINGALEDILIGELADQSTWPAKMEGKVFGKFDITAKAASEAVLKNTLAGDVKVEIKEGKLLDINILKEVLSKISVISDLENKVKETLPAEYQKKLELKDTLFSKIIFDGNIAQGVLTIETADIEADEFLVEANGTVDLNENLNLSTRFFFPPFLSKAMMDSVPELSGLVDDKNRIVIPMTPYQGKLQNVKIYPDIGIIATKVLRTTGKEELKKAIFDAIGIEEEEPPAQGGQTSEQPTQRPEAILIENILDSLPIFK